MPTKEGEGLGQKCLVVSLGALDVGGGEGMVSGPAYCSLKKFGINSLKSKSKN